MNIRVSSFGKFLRNSNRNHTDGRLSGVEFREEFLMDLDKESWFSEDNTVSLDFEGVDFISPAWIRGLFLHYFKNGVTINEINDRILLINLSNIDKDMISLELEELAKQG